jgi:hypothetical protein
MKNLILLFTSILFAGSLTAQMRIRDTTGLHTVKTYDGKKLRHITEYDRNGNCIFSRSDGMSGPVIMLESTTYDSLNREIFSISAHSNLGFYVSETVYEPLLTKVYVYEIDSIYSESGFYFGESSHAIIAKIDTKKELDNCKNVRKILKGEKHLQQITWYNGKNEMLGEVYFDQKNDTSTLELYEYDSSGETLHFHNEWRGGMKAEWDCYYFYDTNGNQLQMIRVEDKDGIKDTSEISQRKYSATNKLLERTELRHGRFEYREVYEYNEKDQLIRQRDYNKEETNLVRTTTYEYDKNGKLVRKMSDDAPYPTHPAFHYRVKRKYWKK